MQHRMFSSFFPRGWNDLHLLSDAALFHIEIFPVQVFADELVFREVKRLRGSFIVALYALAASLVLSQW
ncbi:hypothetical protein MHM39_05675 [Phaeobacter sp. CNT1-3]|nr:hypothetical protein [Phaeobacter sp. CNT1-3]